MKFRLVLYAVEIKWFSGREYNYLLRKIAI